MTQKNKTLFCDRCVYLDPPESHPDTDFHWCIPYKKRVFHKEHHPHIVRCGECIKNSKFKNREKKN